MKAICSAIGIIIALALLLSVGRCSADTIVPDRDNFEGPGAKWDWVSDTDEGRMYPDLAYTPGNYDAEVPDNAKILGWWEEQCLKIDADRTYARSYFTPAQWAVSFSYDLYLEHVSASSGIMLSAYEVMGSTNPIVMRATQLVTGTMSMELEIGTVTDTVVLKTGVPYHISVAVDSIMRHWSWSVNGGMEGYGSYQPFTYPGRTGPTVFNSVMYLFLGSNQVVYLDNIEVLPAKAGYGSYLPITQGG